MFKISEIIGYIGMVCTLSAYLLVNLDLLSVKELLYPILNILASIFFFYSVWAKKAWAAAGLQVIWGLIALGALIPMIF